MFRDLPHLYRLPSCTRCWGGSSGSGAIGQAGNIEAQGANQAAQTEQQYLGQALGLLQPYTAAGTSATNLEGAMLNLPGYGTIDETKQLTGTPGYKFLQDQMNKSLLAYGSKSGLQGSGAAMKGAEAYGGQLAQTYALGPYMSALQQMSGQGAGAAGQGAGLTMQAGSAIGGDYMAAANARAQALIQQANAQAANQSSTASDIFGGLGFVGGLALAPFTGGASLGLAGLGSAVGKGLGSIFNPTPDMGGASSSWSMEAADGGFIPGSTSVLVGERGPEVVQFDQPGTVIPNHLLPYMASSNYTSGLALGR